MNFYLHMDHKSRSLRKVVQTSRSRLFTREVTVTLLPTDHWEKWWFVSGHFFTLNGPSLSVLRPWSFGSLVRLGESAVLRNGQCNRFPFKVKAELFYSGV